MPDQPDNADNQPAEESPGLCTGTGPSGPEHAADTARPSSQMGDVIAAPDGDSTPVRSLSWSQIETLLSCGEKYRLSRVLHAPRIPAWWFIGGSLVHELTEHVDFARYDYGHLLSDEELKAVTAEKLARLILEADEDEPDRSRWDGQGSATKPTGETWWREQAPPMVDGWSAWLEGSGMEIMRRPSPISGCRECPNWSPQVTACCGAHQDRLAIELDMSADIEGVRVRAIADRILLDRGNPVTVDIKTGSRKPITPFQLALQALLVEATEGVRVDWGMFFMTRKGEPTPPMDLRPAKGYLTRMLADAREIIDRGLFIPQVTDMCRMCGVRRFCRLQGGDPTSLENRDV